MEEYSDCCGAPRHHIFEELCGDCLEHCEFTDWDGIDEQVLQSKHDRVMIIYM